MVTLSRIYTRTGDQGMTRLGDNTRVSKTDERIEAYGGVDELNAIIGLVLSEAMSENYVKILKLVQNDLFDLGADLCYPLSANEEESEHLRISAGQVERLEEAIDQINRQLKPLRSFILPGGSKAAAWLHLARTVCRRVERQVWRLAAQEVVNQRSLIYLNRLSDLLFVMSRAENDAGAGDVLWEAGKTQKSGKH